MKKSLLFPLIASALLIGSYSQLYSQEVIKRDKKTGRIRWSETKEEAFFMGANYIFTFSTPYQICKERGIDMKKMIDIDTYNLARMGLNAFRVHMWESEITDVDGNLLDNEHLELFDYLIYKLQDRGIYTMLTPIYFGDSENGKNATGSLSSNYNKIDAHVIPECIDAQANYLKQLMNHVNPYTKLSYKEDPMIVAIEVCNEPFEKSTEHVKSFATRMKNEIASTGCKKPIFYNCTTIRDYANDVLQTNIDGGTFQWYPTDLKTSRELYGNFLPHVDNYTIPFEDKDYFQNKTKAIYEFGPSNIMEPYMYPAMSISFKEKGFQWATMFSYDPIAIAEANNTYYPQYMNLIYTPAKAISYIIASELFINPKYNRDRSNETHPFEMDDFRMDYDNRLTQILDSEKFYYTGNTNDCPDMSSVKHIIGYESSPVVKYSGLGAYFLDKISDSVWRLEVLPDAIRLKDPQSNALVDDIKTLVRYNEQQMKLNIESLGQNFKVVGVNSGNSYNTVAKNGEFSIIPGSYLLSESEIDSSLKNSKAGNYTISEFNAAQENGDLNRTYFIHNPKKIVNAYEPFNIDIRIVTEKEIETVRLVNPIKFTKENNLFKSLDIPFEKIGAYDYSVEVPKAGQKPGFFKYSIEITYKDGDRYYYPGEEKYKSLDYFEQESYGIRIIDKKEPLQLFYAGNQEDIILFSQSYDFGYNVEKVGIAGDAVMVFGEGKWNDYRKHPDGSGAKFAMQQYIGDLIGALGEKVDNYSQISVKAKGLSDTPALVKLILADTKGVAFSTTIKMTKDKEEYDINLDNFKEDSLFLLPRPYPNHFFPFWYKDKSKAVKNFDISEIERVQIVVPEEGNIEIPQFELNSIILK